MTSVEANSSVDYQVRYTAVGGTPTGDFSSLGSGITNTATVIAANGDGLYEFKAVVTDAAGNTASSNVFKANVAASPPTLVQSGNDAPSVTVDANTDNSIGETYTLNLTFDKPVNGLTSGTDSTVFNDGDSGVAAAWGGDNGSATRTLRTRWPMVIAVRLRSAKLP